MEKESDDELISKKKFQKASGVNLDNFLIGSIEEEVKEEEIEEVPETDEAMGEISELFTRDIQTALKKDGTVDAAPERDTVTEYAVEGEKRLHFGLMVSMIVVWSAIGTVVGLTLSPLLSTIGLILMAVFGLWLGEIWIPKARMKL